MLTQSKSDEYRDRSEIYCLSTDQKPNYCGNGSVLIEMDTGDIYFFDAENHIWRKFEA